MSSPSQNTEYPRLSKKTKDIKEPSSTAATHPTNMNIIKRVSRRLNTKRSSFNEQDGSPSSSRDSSEYFSAVEHSTADQNSNNHHQAYLSASMSHVISSKRQSQSLDPRNSASLSDLGLSSSSSHHHHQQYHHQRSSLTSRRTITSLKRNSVNSAGGTSALNGSSNSSHPGYVPSYCKFKVRICVCLLLVMWRRRHCCLVR